MFETLAAATRLTCDQQPRQIDPIILSTFASSRSMAGLVPSSGPFIGPLPTPDDESTTPNELEPGAAALVPKAPPVADRCDPMPPPRASAAAVKRPTQTATQGAKISSCRDSLERAINVTVENLPLARTFLCSTQRVFLVLQRALHDARAD